MANKRTPKPSRKRCQQDGCRKLAVTAGVCTEHTAAQNPMDHVIRLTELERLRYLETDNNLRNQSQEVLILRQQQRLEDIDYNQRKTVRSTRIAELTAAIQLHTQIQRDMLADFGKTYAVNPARISIDDKTGVIQEHAEGS